MRTHIELDDRLMREAMKLGGQPTRTAALRAALETYINSLKRAELLTLQGKVAWSGDADQLRADRTRRPRRR